MWASLLDSADVGGICEKWGNFCFLKWEVVGEVITFSQLFNTYEDTLIASMGHLHLVQTNTLYFTFNI